MARKYDLISELYNRTFEMVMNNYKVFHIPCFESVRRTRQKIQAATPELGCSPEVRRARRKQQGKFKAYATDKRK